jgi:hypothetical protein
MQRQARVGERHQFAPVDVGAYVADVGKPKPRLGTWGVVAILAGTILAVGVVVFENYIVTLF